MSELSGVDAAAVLVRALLAGVGQERSVVGGGEQPRFYSVAQVAELLGMSSMTVYRAISEGGFPAVRIRSRLLVPARALEAMVEAAVAGRTVVDAADFVPELGVVSGGAR